MHEGKPVLSTEVHKFDLAHTGIKVDTWTELRVTGKTKVGSSDLYHSVHM